MMREKNRAAASAFRDLREKFVARLARRGFDRHLLFRGQRTNVGRLDGKIDIVFGGEFFDETRIGRGRSAAQLMIQMADDQIFVAKIDKRMQERDGIAAAGDADEIARLGREMPQDGRINLNPIHAGGASNVRCQ